MQTRTLSIAVVIVLGGVVPAMLLEGHEGSAMPIFAQAYGVKCSVCHTLVPQLNAYGRFVQASAYSTLDRQTLNRALPVWIDESLQYDSTAGAGTGVPRYNFGNLGIHALGYATPNITYHIQQWFVQDNQSGGLDTAWVSYNNLLNRDAHLYVGKIEPPAPSVYSMTSDIDGPTASATLVGEHDWGATFDNRWGTKVEYAHNNLDLQGGYLWSGADLNGATDFSPGDKSFEWKLSFSPVKVPVTGGFFGSLGSLPVSTGQDHYWSYAPYLQIDPHLNGIPGLLAVYQWQGDNNPGIDENTGLAMPSVWSRGSSVELYESLFKGNAVFSVRHDINYDGFRTVTVGNALNFGFNVPHFPYAHVYFETLLGGESSLLGASGGPQWKATLWLTLPVREAK